LQAQRALQIWLAEACRAVRFGIKQDDCKKTLSLQGTCEDYMRLFPRKLSFKIEIILQI